VKTKINNYHFNTKLTLRESSESPLTICGFPLMSLLNECLEALGDNTVVLSMPETENVFSIFEDMFSITS